MEKANLTKQKEKSKKTTISSIMRAQRFKTIKLQNLRHFQSREIIIRIRKTRNMHNIWSKIGALSSLNNRNFNKGQESTRVSLLRTKTKTTLIKNLNISKHQIWQNATIMRAQRFKTIKLQNLRHFQSREIIIRIRKTRNMHNIWSKIGALSSLNNRNFNKGQESTRVSLLRTKTKIITWISINHVVQIICFISKRIKIFFKIQLLLNFFLKILSLLVSSFVLKMIDKSPYINIIKCKKETV